MRARDSELPEPDRLTQVQCAGLEHRIGQLLIEEDLEPALVLQRVVEENPTVPVTAILYVLASFHVSLGEFPHGSEETNARLRQQLLEQIAGLAAELYALECLGFPSPPKAADLHRFWRMSVDWKHPVRPPEHPDKGAGHQAG